MADRRFEQQLGIGVASITFGVALSIFIYAAVSGAAADMPAWILYVTSFLLMLRFWWRYNELFVRNAPSSGYWQFLFDFGTSFFGILAVLFVGDIQMWAALGAAAMLASAVRCGLSWNAVTADAKKRLKRTAVGAIGMFMLFGAVYALAATVSRLHLAAAIFVVVVLFVIRASRQP